MNIFQSILINGRWQPELPESSEAGLILLFGDRGKAQSSEILSVIQNAFTKAQIIGCSTSGEIMGTRVFDQTLVLTAVQFDTTKISTHSVSIEQYDNSFIAGEDLASQLEHQDLKCVFVLSDGQKINGSELVAGLTSSLPANVSISGGLAGDDARFEETIVWHNERAQSGLITICGFYGDNLKIGHGSLGGWDSFGPERIVTRSESNVLYELDGRPALELYKSYLGEESKKLPSSALLFPLSIQADVDSEPVVRTILNIDEEQQSMTFAGDIPEGYSAKLMKANFERLVDGAVGAASNALEKLSENAELAILVSCVGRRLVLKQRVDDELEGVDEILTDRCVKCGFYSYGEISPLVSGTGCHIHNQTMTITTFSEA
ncbi:MAG: FIST C-terminal domain-containing protein [Kangiellaceae bacterium]|nr:FIST C-terminal domain-containing protein [Kangiellaceae bacterium]